MKMSTKNLLDNVFVYENKKGDQLHVFALPWHWNTNRKYFIELNEQEMVTSFTLKELHRPLNDLLKEYEMQFATTIAQ
jgi:hypothetical protein